MHNALAPAPARTIVEDEPLGAAPELGLHATLKGVMVGGYCIDREISKGHTNEVYLAVHPLLATRAAVKILSSSRADLVERFIVEARLAATLRHPHIVQVYDLVSLSDGRMCIVMEYLEGQTLEDFAGRTPMNPQRARAILLQVCSALAATHQRGVIHRDLKAQNILLVGHNARDYVKLLDFGLAKIETATSAITSPGLVVGTPHYMSPEQIRGDEVDRRTDIYSLGVLAYRLLTGRVPFDGTPTDVMLRHLQMEPPELTGVPTALKRIILRALAKVPADRFDSVVQFGRELHSCSLTDRPLTDQPYFTSQQTPGRVNVRFASEDAFRHVEWYEMSLGRLFVPGPPPLGREPVVLSVEVPGRARTEALATILGVFDDQAAKKHGIAPGFALKLAALPAPAPGNAQAATQTMRFVAAGSPNVP